MKKLHTNTSAFGLLSPKMQADFRAARDNKSELVEYDSSGEWIRTNARTFYLHRLYRVVKKDVTNVD
jgi:hypothetical protein